MSYPAKMIAHLRNLRGMTQAQLAENIGISRAYLARIETKLQFPSLEMLNSIAGALDVPVGFLLLDKDDLPDSPLFRKLTKLIDQIISKGQHG